MARNAEVIRQWQVLRAIDAARNGVPIAKVASAQGVHQRTTRRDIEALSKAGFPLYDDRVAGRIVWKLSAKPFRGLEETGLSVTELCALYFSRSILETLAGAPFRHETERAFMKLERALPVASRKFLDRFPRILKAKVTGRKKQDEKKVREFLARAVDASLRQRRVLMQYDSISSRRTKEYKVDPLRLSYADGGIYLIAWVEEYGQVRTFAVERIRTLASWTNSSNLGRSRPSPSRSRWECIPKNQSQSRSSSTREWLSTSRGASGTGRRLSTSAPTAHCS
jgi:predicted DNA-binding transcriptional regulator YafY